MFFAAAAVVVGVVSINPARLPLAARVSPRFQSYNIEMVEITGGRFWRPYPAGPASAPTDRYAERAPVDLGNPRLRRLARALGPAHVRVSGTWANTTWYAESATAERPAGFAQTLTRLRLAALGDYLRATDGTLVTSFAGSAGTRDAAGRWQPRQMEAFVRDTRALGIRIAAAEYLNEPNLVAATGAPANYAAADWGHDFGRFAKAFRRAAPGALVIGPGSIGDGSIVERAAAAAGVRLLPTAALLAAQRDPVDVFSYHYYGGVSQRCATSGPLAVTREQALDASWLARSETGFELYRTLRDRYAPGKPMWLTETGQAACGGSPWAATFVDTPRYVDQLGRLARRGVQVVMHNTLAVSDYALLDSESFAPRPSYWAALLWSRLMGTRVLGIDSGHEDLRVYAHCLKGRPGGVALVAINLADAPRQLRLPGRVAVYALTGDDADRAVRLNGRVLELGTDDALPPLEPTLSVGEVNVTGRSLAFITTAARTNAQCP